MCETPFGMIDVINTILSDHIQVRHVPVGYEINVQRIVPYAKMEKNSLC